MKYLDAEEINELAVRRNVKEKKGPQGIEIMDALFGAVHVDKLSNDEMVVLRDADGKLDLELAPLP